MQSQFNRRKFLFFILMMAPLGVSAAPVTATKVSAPKRAVPGSSWVNLQVSTDKLRYTAGEPIQVTLKATNIQKKDAYLKFSSGQRFDFKVFKIGEKQPAYVWSAGRMFAMMTGTVRLKKAEREIYQAKIGAEMGELSPGEYRLEAHLTNSSQVRARPIEFRIVPKNAVPKNAVPKNAVPNAAADRGERATLAAGEKRDFLVEWNGQALPAAPVTIEIH